MSSVTCTKGLPLPLVKGHVCEPPEVTQWETTPNRDVVLPGEAFGDILRLPHGPDPLVPQNGALTVAGGLDKQRDFYKTYIKHK